MKSIQKYLVRFGVMLILLNLFTLLACKDDNDPDPIAQNLALLASGTWNISSVTVDGTDQTSLFNGLSITFQDQAFSSANGGPVWPASGTWQFADATGTSFTRDDGVSVIIQALTEANLTLQLQWNETTLNSGRTSSIEGQHVFSFTK